MKLHKTGRRTYDMRPVDARRRLVAKFLQSTGPVTLPGVCERFGWTEREVRNLLNGLVREGKVAEGKKGS